MRPMDPTPQGNVKVLNDRADVYRFFDATPHAEFLYECVQRTIEQDLPKEIRFLRSFDAFRAGVENMMDLPERTLNNLLFLQQNEGRLSRRARDNEFSQLTPDEVAKIEELYRTAFSNDTGTAS
ncbi:MULTISPECIES: hypothetical protein [unclassified Bradyrhizobium]|uniref:hypothetical protein n=1 Tax=unclassified Bradyrhizobium TaxID=2631580 RepID=UPI001FFA9C2E|nr:MULTISPECIES: hypothetical protein [unclassified Bradyrhizobium]